MKRAIVFFAAMSACKLDTHQFEPKVTFPDGLTGPIPYRAGGQFAVQIEVDINNAPSSHATAAVLPTTATAAAPALQTITLNPLGDELLGVGTLTWPLGGEVSVQVQAGGETKVEPATLVIPDLRFSTQSITDNGTGWTYAYCLESTTDDGNVALHVDGAALANGMTDGMLTLIREGCDTTTDPAIRSHATFTVVATANYHATATLSTYPYPFVQPQVPVQSHVTPTIKITSPSAPFSPLSVVELDIDVMPALAGFNVALQAIPPTQQDTVVPSTVTTDSNGHAVAHFQMPASGSVEIDGSIGAARGSAQFP